MSYKVKKKYNNTKYIYNNYYKKQTKVWRIEEL